MSKRILAMLLALVLVVGMVPTAAFASEVTFTDATGHWAEEALYTWYRYGAITGYGDGTIGPDNILKKDELATILSAAIHLTEQTEVSPFLDVTENDWFFTFMMKCHAAGIIAGYNGYADPEKQLTRQDALVMMAQAMRMDIENVDLSVLDQYTDKDQIADYAKPYIAALVAAGAVDSVSTTEKKMGPTQPITRAQIVTILNAAVVKYINESGEYELNETDGIVIVVADDVTITGEAYKIVVSADNVAINTDGTELSVIPGSENVTENGNAVAAGDTVITEKEEAQPEQPAPQPPIFIHTHTYANTWSSDANGHWHAATCSHDVKKDEAGHTEEEIPAVAPTCTAVGWTAGSKCSVCGYIFTAQAEISALGHNYEPAVTTAATCTTAGVTTYTCTRCNDQYTEDIPATGHTAVTDAAVSATCTTTGLTEGSHCSTCGEVIVAQKIAAATGHSYAESVTKNATCTTAGEKTVTCSKCNDSYTETILATGHSWDDGVDETDSTNCGDYKLYTCGTCQATKKEATGTSSHSFGENFVNQNDGNHAKVCRTCGALNDITAHIWNDGEVTTSAGCTTTGVKTYTCTATGCGATKTETIAATGHKFTVDTWTHDAGADTHSRTCENAGCNETQTIPCTFGNWTAVVNEDESSDSHQRTCEDCGNTQTGNCEYTNFSVSADHTVGTFTCQYCTNYITKNYVAKIKDETTSEYYFETLAEAFTGDAAGRTILLLTDIDMTNKTWNVIDLKGIFDGQDHTISNLTTNLFGTVSGTVQNLNVDTVTITNTAKNGANGFISAVAEGGLVDNCTVSNVTITWSETVTDTADCYGGVISRVSAGATVQNCAFSNITMQAYGKLKRSGGAFAEVTGKISKCTINGLTLIATDNNSGDAYLTQAGGIIADLYAGSEVSDCTFNNVTVTADEAFNTGGIIGKAYVTGTAGPCEITLKNITVNGLKLTAGNTTITSYATVKNVGGFIGQMDSRNNDSHLTMDNCHITGLDMTVASSKKGEDPSAGFISSLNGGADITNCSVAGKIDGTKEFIGIGGFLGCVGGYGAGNDYTINITDCSANVAITGNDNIFVGGFVAYAGSYNQTMTKNLALNFTNCKAAGSFYGKLETGTNEVSTFTNCTVDGVAFAG